MIRLLLQGGDTMLGRAVQLTLPHQAPGEALLNDSATADMYLSMAMHRVKDRHVYPMQEQELKSVREWNVDGSYLWGDYVSNTVIQPPPDVRLLNLETAVTQSMDNRDIPRKYIKYHLHAKNLPLVLESMAAATFTGAPKTSSHIPYVVSFANNHAMDFGRTAFEQESLPALANLPGKGLVVGAGRNDTVAKRAVRISLFDGTRERRAVSVIAVTTECSGTPFAWAASAQQAGVVCLPALISRHAVTHSIELLSDIFVANGLHPSKRPHNDLVVLSIHWGPNWAYQASTKLGDLDFQRYRQQLAQRMIRELGVDLIYGHSSHHIRGLELFEGKLIIYGAGDLIDDYEGFSNPSEDEYNKLGALFVVDVQERTGSLSSLRLVPMRMDRLQLRRVEDETISVWDPRSERGKEVHGAVTTLRDAINKFSVLDAGDCGRSIRLRVVHDDRDVPGGPILLYP